MPSLLVVVFVLQLVIHLINTVGAAAIDNLVSFITIKPLVLLATDMNSSYGAYTISSLRPLRAISKA